MYRKFIADHIYNGHEILPGNQVLIADEAGLIIDIVEKNAAGEGITIFEGMLTPGFINCHCHLELSHLFGLIPEKTGLVDFLIRVVNERQFDETKIFNAIAKAEDQMLQNGIVAVGDICNNTLTLSQKRKDRLFYHNFIETMGVSPAEAEIRFQQSVLFCSFFQSSTQGSSVVPHAPYSVSKKIFQLINELEDNNLLTIHNQESEAENELFKHKKGDLLRLYEKMKIDISSFQASGKSSLQTWLPYLNNGQSVIMVHNVTTSAQDLDFIKLPTGPGSPTAHRAQRANSELSTFLCLCPNANLYISNTLPNVNLFLENQCTIVLGTDSLASNHQLNILEEIKTLQKNFPQIKLETMLQWATLNGAKALQMQDFLGSFEKGKKPGIVLISDMEGLNLTKGSLSRRII